MNEVKHTLNFFISKTIFKFFKKTNKKKGACVMLAGILPDNSSDV